MADVLFIDQRLFRDNTVAQEFCFIFVTIIVGYRYYLARPHLSSFSYGLRGSYVSYYIMSPSYWSVSGEGDQSYDRTFSPLV